MATSGSIDYNLNAREIIDFAFSELRVVMAGETATADQSNQALRKLNVMLKTWQRYANLWRMTEGSVTLVASTYQYTLSPMPHRVITMRYRDTNSRDLPMNEMERDAYFDMPLKTTTGIPTQYYVDYQRASAVLYLWQALASVSGETIRYTFQRKFEDVDSLDNDLDVKQDWLETVGMNLAYRLGASFGRVGSQSFSDIKERALILLEEMQDDDREDTVRFVPGYGTYA